MEPSRTGKRFSQVVLKVDYVLPTVHISEYSLVTDSLEAQRKDAEAIMQRKKDMPLAMQKHDAALFNSWLGRDLSRVERMSCGEGKNTYRIVLMRNGAFQMFAMKISHYSFSAKLLC